MSKKADKIEKSEVMVLLPEVEFDGYTIKPWTMKQLVKLTPLLGSVARALKERGIDLSKLDDPSISDKEITLEDIVSCVTEVADNVPFLISTSLNLDLEKVESMPWGQGLAVVAVIVGQNWEHIKNYWGLIPWGVKDQTKKGSTPSLLRRQ